MKESYTTRRLSDNSPDKRIYYQAGNNTLTAVDDGSPS